MKPLVPTAAGARTRTRAHGRTPGREYDRACGRPHGRTRGRRFARTAAVLAVVAAAVAGCGSTSSGSGPEHDRDSAGKQVRQPPKHAGFDYQIGGGYRPADGVRVVSRDRGDRPASGRYNLCYVNAFQAQPDALDWWEQHHPRLLLRTGGGKPVMDREWDEALFDTSTAARRAALARIVGGWIDGCAEKGFQAVELDNLDSAERSGGRLDHADNVKFAALLTRRAHQKGLAAGQKNAAELLNKRSATGFDFAVTEQCGRYDECGQYARAYDDRVLDVEYDTKGMAAACRKWGDRLSVVRRDMDVRPRGQSGYVFEQC
ncbi:endo alpha-1,4 polygalactosaminidase [Streptomyces albus subsp. chlorinus]|uniref:endo alpha-1,4 polygalactosaminidase n=1 Tax=Streptomyces albus TaxID=1888 RepID=UPI00157049AC|nr:endo alpha-1,4 polygalactosaminidase [Streptomyces albus]NSC24760.1 endo alpha-1,4 polygalactosaminidase [Streptomyces albus subsp. chlorinus]